MGPLAFGAHFSANRDIRPSLLPEASIRIFCYRNSTGRFRGNGEFLRAPSFKSSAALYPSRHFAKSATPTGRSTYSVINCLDQMLPFTCTAANSITGCSSILSSTPPKPIWMVS